MLVNDMEETGGRGPGKDQHMLGGQFSVLDVHIPNPRGLSCLLDHQGSCFREQILELYLQRGRT